MSLFGSAASGEFRQGDSDLDFLVEFSPLPPSQRAKHFFALESELQQLLGVTVDLGEPEGMRYARFRESVERSMIPIYAAA